MYLAVHSHWSFTTGAAAVTAAARARRIAHSRVPHVKRLHRTTRRSLVWWLLGCLGVA